MTLSTHLCLWIVYLAFGQDAGSNYRDMVLADAPMGSGRDFARSTSIEPWDSAAVRDYDTAVSDAVKLSGPDFMKVFALDTEAGDRPVPRTDHGQPARELFD